MRSALLLLALTGCAAGAADTPAQQLPEAFNPMVSFAPLVKAVEPAVVNVYVTSRRTVNVPQQYQFFFGLPDQQERVQQGQGSGFVISPDGYILTNNHVADGATEIKVKFANDEDYTAKVVGTDPTSDVALLKIDAKRALPWLKLGDSEKLDVGDWVMAAGNPLGLGHSVSAGIVSGKGRFMPDLPLDEFIQTDASINPGNSGGPLCDLEGRVLGVNTMIVGRGSGIGFAVPSNMARRVAEQLLRSGKVERAWIGVGIQDLTPELAAAMGLGAGAGALVNAVNPDGPAQRANLKPGDVIAAVDGKAVHDGRELIREIIAREVGKVVPIEVLREGKRYTSQVTLAARPEPRADALPMQRPTTAPSGLGLTVRDLTAEQAASVGLRAKPIAAVAALVPGSAADRAGLKAGDVIVEVDGRADPTAVQVQEAARDGQILVRLKRKSASFYAVVKR